MSNETDNDSTQPKTIDDAIATCETIIKWHRFNSRLMLVLLVAATWALYEAFKKLEQISEQVNAVSGGVLDPEIITKFLGKMSVYPYIIFGLFIAVFGIIVALYRFHMNEISRNEQIKIGFWRIRIAARNTDSGFQTEVRQALTKDAFSFNPKPQGGKGKQMESPVPGHPASEVLTTLLNKILDKLEINVSKKE